VVNMGIRLLNKEPHHIINLDNFKSWKRELISCLLHLDFYLVDEFMSF